MSEFPTNIMIAKVRDWAILPTRKHADDSGLDLYFCNVDACVETQGYGGTLFDYGQTPIVGTGIAIAIPKGLVGIVTRCSGTKFSVETGVIDAGYTGEIMVRLRSEPEKGFFLENGVKIAQLLLLPIWTPALHEVDYAKFPKTERGANGGIVKSFKDIG